MTKKLATGPARCRRKFLHYFKRGFQDETYFEWEREYKERAHAQWKMLRRDLENLTLTS